MVLRAALGWLIPLMFSFTAIAEEINLNPTHPSHYLVVEGDSLWEIASKFLKKPAQWPLLWQANPQIDNPNLIYPGDVLGFSMTNGQPRISVVSRRGSKSTISNGGIEKLSPKIRENALTEAIELLPSTAIDQYLSSPKVVTENELEQSPYVVSFAGEHLVGGAGDRIYVRAIKNPEGLNYTVFRKGQTYVDPENNAVLGYEAEYIADALLQKPGDPATLNITKSNSEIRSGDRLLLNSAAELTLNYFPRPPEKPINGSIISVLNGVSQIGQYNIVVLNKGLDDGLAVGHVLDIYQRGKVIVDPFAEEKNSSVALPDEMAGSLMVFRTFKNISYALIMQASQAIHILDSVQTP